MAVLGLGPIGDMACRVARRAAPARCSASTWCPSGWQRAAARGVDVVDLRDHPKDLADTLHGRTGGRGPDSVIKAVGMEAHGAPLAKAAQRMAGLLPDPLQASCRPTY